MHSAVLGRVVLIEPQSDGSGLLKRRGKMHLFNGDDYWNSPGLIFAWCGTAARGVDLEVVEDREQKQPLAADLCKRCFLPVRRQADPQAKRGA